MDTHLIYTLCCVFKSGFNWRPIDQIQRRIKYRKKNKKKIAIENKWLQCVFWLKPGNLCVSVELSDAIQFISTIWDHYFFMYEKKNCMNFALYKTRFFFSLH